jgi:ribonucleoside-diphosphate reductase alpha chain
MRVKLQGALQAFIDHGVSSTLNMDENVTSEYVQGIYEEAWKYGLKGVTVYRDNSRSGVLVTGQKSETVLGITEHDAPKRPDILPCHIERATVEGEKWTIFVGLLEGKPYEIFGGLSDNIEIPKKYAVGYIKKRKCDKKENASDAAKARKACYDLIAGDEDDPLVIKDVVSNFNDDKYGWGTRMLSTMLRHGVPLKYIVEQLKRSHGASLHSFNKAMARVLSKYETSEYTGLEKPDNCKSGNCD